MAGEVSTCGILIRYASESVAGTRPTGGYATKAVGATLGIADYVTGKTADEVSGIAVDESTHPTDADLASSVTIAIGGFQALIAKAAQ